MGKWSRHMDNQHLRQLSRASETWPLRSCTSPPARPNGENEPGVQNPHQLRNGRTTTQFTQTGSLGAKEKIIRNPTKIGITINGVNQRSPSRSPNAWRNPSSGHSGGPPKGRPSQHAMTGFARFIFLCGVSTNGGSPIAGGFIMENSIEI